MIRPSVTLPSSLPGVLILAAAALLVGCDTGTPGAGEAQPEDTHGRLVIIGGGLQAENTPVYQAILDGRSGEGPVCVFPTASASPQGSMESAVERIDAVGGPGTAEGIFLSRDNPEDASLPEIAERIRGCSGFYFSGGSQSRIVDVFRPEGGDTPAFQALMERFEAGAVVSGSSAGAAMMSDPMIAGGGSVEALTVGIRAQDGEDGVRVDKGLGFLEDPLVDQHFLARGRWGRLLVAVLETEAYTYGAGIDENTALVVDGDSALVVGASGVVFLDTRSVQMAEVGRGASNAVLHLLGDGDRVNLADGTVHFAEGKDPVFESEAGPELGSLDLFEDWHLLTFFAGSAASQEREFAFTQDGFEFQFRKGDGYRAVASSEGEGVQGLPPGLAVGPLHLAFSETEQD